MKLGPQVELEVPARAAAEPLVFSLGATEAAFQPGGLLRQVFGLHARGAVSGHPVTRFQAALRITVTYDPTGLDPVQEQSLRLAYWDREGAFWSILPTRVELQAHTVTAETDHFTDYSVIQDDGTNPSANVVWPQSADVNNYEVDLFGGSATVRYPLELPPGTGGLTPKVAITGSSAVAFGRRRARYELGRSGMPNLQDAGWLGAGFELDLPYIERHKVTRGGQQQDRYTLSFGGGSHKLIAAGTSGNVTSYRTEDEQFLRVESVGNDFWVVTARDGTKYTFGFTFDPGVRPPGVTTAFPYSPKLNYVEFPDLDHSGNWIPFTWYVSKIEDTSGNAVVLGYDRFKDSQGGNFRRVGLGTQPGCNAHLTEYDQAVFPAVMTYSYVSRYGSGAQPALGSTPQVRVYFNRSGAARQDFAQMSTSKLRSDNCIQGFYDDRALDSIDVTVLDGAGERLVRRYQMEYEDGIPLVLRSVQQLNGTQALPALSLDWGYYTHSFNPDDLYRLFDRIDNGYSGAVTYAYEFVQPGASYVDQWGNGSPRQALIVLPRVVTRTADPGESGQSPAVVRSYAYGPAAGNGDPIEPEFLGYGSVTVTEGAKAVEHDFLRGDNATVTMLDGSSYTSAKQTRGQAWRTVTREGTNVLEAVEQTFAAIAGNGTPAGSAFVQLTKRQTYRYPSGATLLADPGRKASTSTFQYDAFGNTTQRQDLDAAGALYRTTTRDYLQNTAAWIVDRVFHERLYDGASVLQGATASFYDVDYSGSNPPGEQTQAPPTQGRLTMVRRAISGTEQVDAAGRCIACARTHYAYDEYGNRTRVIDARGNATTTAYDATKTYPASVTYPLVGTATATWDVGLGKPRSSTDVNGQTTSYDYDAFGRLTKVARPGNTLDAPTTSYQYTDAPSAWQPVSNYAADAGSASYVRAGWTDAATKFTTDMNQQLFFSFKGDTAYEQNDTIGRVYAAPAGARIVRATFDYQTVYDNTFVYLGMDSSSAMDAWKNDARGGGGSVDLRYDWDNAPTWVGFGFFVRAHIGVGAGSDPASWNGRITNLVLYYSTDHRVTTKQRVDATTSRSEVDFYDGFGRLIETKAADDGGLQATTFRSYDVNGRLAQESVPTWSTTTALERPDWTALAKTAYAYDALDRERTASRPSSGTTTTTYNAWTNTVVDANGHCRSFDRDAGGRLAAVTLWGGVVQGGVCTGTADTTSYAYDATDRLTRVTDAAGNVTQVTYDLLGNKTRVDDPDLGAWTYGYDTKGNLISRVDARGQIVTYQYDALDRVTMVGTASRTLVRAADVNDLRTEVDRIRLLHAQPPYAWANPAGTVSAASPVRAATFAEIRTALRQTPTYEGTPDFTAGPMAAGRAIKLQDLVDLQTWVFGAPRVAAAAERYGYDAGPNGKGRRTGMSDGAGTTSYAYDGRGRLMAATRTQNAPPPDALGQVVGSGAPQTYATSYAYDDADAVVALGYPDGEVVTAAYTRRGLPKTLTSSLGALVTGTTYDALGRATRIDLGDGSATTFGYDAATTRLVSFGAPGVARSYGYDAVGNVACIDPAGAVPCNTAASGVEQVVYDAQDRVDLVRVGGATLHDYAYDRVGDVTLKNEAGTNNALAYTSARPVHAPKTVNGGTYAYDANGNLTSRSAQSLVYDGLNRLAQVTQGTGANATTAVYRYDGDGKLAQRTETALTGSTATDFVGERFEKNLATNQATKRYFLGDRLVATRSGATFSYLYGDYLRSTVAATGGAAAEYAPYGLVRSSSGALPTDRKFQGEQLHAATGLYRVGERWYDPAVGLWTQPDTVVPDPANPLDLNRYAFERGNPLRYRDPSGHAVISDDTGLAAGPYYEPPAPPMDSLDVPEPGDQGCAPSFACSPNALIKAPACTVAGCGEALIPAPLPPPDDSGDPNKPSEFADEIVGDASGSSSHRHYDYRAVFFEAHPELKGKVVVHHAVEQQVLTRYPGRFTEEEIHSLNNLRGIPLDENPDLHLSRIRRAWNEFYRSHPNATRDEILIEAEAIDREFGQFFLPDR